MPLALPEARLCADLPPVQGARADRPAAPRGTETVLILEDDDTVRALLARTLRGLGYSVHVAANSGEALAVQQAHPDAIDAVLSDVVLPHVSGPETVRRLVAAARRVPAVLFMSGHTDHPLLRDGTLQGARNFIQKPLTRMTIACKLREVIDAR